MNETLENILNTKKYTNKSGITVDIHSFTSKAQCLYLQNIIKENKFESSIEIGFAFGTSTLAITEEIVKNGGKHIVIDKYENTGWGGFGIDLIEETGNSGNVDFREEYCYDVLPVLLKEGRRFDFAYIDSTKQFDWLLVNFFYLDKLLDINGIIVFDDVNFPGIRKLLRYISQFPNYKVHSQFPVNKKEKKKRSLAKLLSVLPQPESLLRPEILKTNYELGINAPAIALQKIEDDKRNWDWHVNF